MPSDDVVFKQVKVGAMENFAYLFGSRSAGELAIVDPGFEPDKLLDAAQSQGLEVTAIVLTHSHQDHVANLSPIIRATGAPVYGHPEATVTIDEPVEDGQTLEIAGLTVQALYTPGHCPDHVAYVVDDAYLLSGDALFIEECGRVDLPGSSIDDMYTTLMETIPSLPGHLEVYPGHDYGPEPHRPLSEELEKNYTLEKRDREAFHAFMQEP